MGRPIKKEFIGVLPSAYLSKICIPQAVIPSNAGTISQNVNIIQQKGTGRYIVSDSNLSGLVSLVDGSNNYQLKSGEAAIKISTPKITNKYYLGSLKLNQPGQNYKVGDVLTIEHVGSYTVTKVDSKGSIIEFDSSLILESSGTDMAGTNVPGIGGSGTGATFTIKTNMVKDNVIEYVRKINDRTIITFGNNVYTWNMNNTGEVKLPMIGK